MTDLETFLEDLAEFAKESGVSTATLSRKLLGDGTRYDKLIAGTGGITFRKLAQAKGSLKEMRAGQANAA